MRSDELAAYLDATNLKLDASDGELCALCDEAAQAGYAAVCVYPSSVPLCHDILYNTPVKICTVAGFPHGRSHPDVKDTEIRKAAETGADEIDVVMNHAALRSGETSLVAEEVQRLCETAHKAERTLKVIVETCYLKSEQKGAALEICEGAGADFIKTSTGFGSGGATLEDIAFFHARRTGDIRIKASGGIRDWAGASALIEAGADRLGVSAARQILAGLRDASPAGPGGHGY